MNTALISLSGFVQVIPEEGMPIYGQHDAYGDLYVEYNVVLPKELSIEVRQSESIFCPGCI